MVNRVHVVDSHVRRRARISRELFTIGIGVQIYESVEEFADVDPAEGLLLVADDEGGCLPGILAARSLSLPVVAYSEEPSPEKVVVAIHGGACGYLNWPFEGRNLPGTLARLANEGNQRLHRERMCSRARRRVAELSPREREVLCNLVAGLSNRKIADTLGISPRTVEIHRRNMMTRLQAKTVADAVRIALHAGLDEEVFPPQLQQVA